MICRFVALLAIVCTHGALADGLGAESNERAPVVLAEVTAVQRDAAGDCNLHLRPIATLMGVLDPLQDEDISAFYAMDIPSTVPFGDATELPMKGQKAIVVLVHQSQPRATIYSVPFGPVPFMPKNKLGILSGLCQVTGFDDPKVTETIENLRKLRGKQREDAEKAKAEQNAAAAKKTPPEKSSAK
jgi:hypothetical protein